jgi:diphthamide synthase (EF-2-diphthine--ammonia ligase)
MYLSECFFNVICHTLTRTLTHTHTRTLAHSLTHILTNTHSHTHGAAVGVDAVCCGAILSTYQRIRLEHVCHRLGADECVCVCVCVCVHVALYHASHLHILSLSFALTHSHTHTRTHIHTGLIPLCYLWKMDQSALLTEMVDAGIVAVIVKVAAYGLSNRQLGG